MANRFDYNVYSVVSKWPPFLGSLISVILLKSDVPEARIIAGR